jgi:hypothetical protein
MTWLTTMEYLCHKWPRICSTCKHFPSFPYSRLITEFVTRLTRRVPIVEQELLTLPEHLSSPPVFSGVRGTRSLVLWVYFVDRCMSFCSFSFGHCVVCSSSIYGFWLPLWYLQTRPTQYIISMRNSNNVIPNIASKPNVTNKKTITDNSIAWQETLQTNWLTVGIIHYSKDNGSFFFPLQQRQSLPGVLYETGTYFLREHQGLTRCFWWFHVANLSYFSVLCLVPDVDDISELSICDCPFDFLQHLYLAE